MKPFIGRKEEIQKLKDLYELKKTSLSVIKGRRRIGKSSLVFEFVKRCAQGKQFFSFTGLAPTDGVSAQSQRDHFGHQLSSHLHVPPMTFHDWTEALTYLAHHIKEEGAVVLFDEISWMGAKDPAFVSKLKAWWDTVLLKKPHVLLIFCGSVSTWIDENIINSTAFFGRISLTITLEAFSIPESAEFLRTLGTQGSPFEIYKLLSVLGGVPWYLEHLQPNMTADQNIKNLCFQKEGLLVREFDRIFHDLFNGSGSAYKKILDSLKEGMKTLADVRRAIAFPASGTLSLLMKHLVTCGFVSQHRQWSLKTEKPLKQSLYRICDPYLRFYLKMIEPHKHRIDQGAYEDIELSQIQGFEIHISLQVEHLLLQNRSLLLQKMGIPSGETVFDGPYRQTKTVRTKGCQIDYLVQSSTKNLFLCEFKFKRRELGIEIIDEMKEKMCRFSVPRGFAMVPVLFHMGGVSEPVYDKRFFYRIIDIADFL